MKYVEEKKYLGEIVTSNMKNEKNIQDKTNKAFGNIRKIEDTLNERPFGIHTYKAAMLLRGGVLLGSLLNNIEAMVNVTKSDLEKLEKPDLVLQEKLLPSTGNASKCFRYLELGITPVKYVIIQKRLQFLKHILDESINSMLSQVYYEQKRESKKGDFVNMVAKDLLDVGIDMNVDEIKNMSKGKWKNLCKERTKNLAFIELIKEHETKEKTKYIKFACLEMSEYLKENKKTHLLKIIFLLRSGTLDIKKWNSWKYDDNLCVMCDIKEENITHFLECYKYGKEKIEIKDICTQNTETLFSITERVEDRMIQRKEKIESGLDSPSPGSKAPTVVVEHYWNKIDR